jgi:hypothetical protein
MIDLEILKTEAVHYNSRLDVFFAEKNLPEVWLDYGQDHVAVKAYNLRDYEEIIENFKVVSELITEVDRDGRHIATARLLGSLALELNLSLSSWVALRDIEIMLSRPDEQSDDLPRFDHSEIFMPRGLIPVRSVLTAKGIRLDEEQNETHAWISVVFGDEADEVKFADRRLRDINEADIASRKARIIHQVSV